MFPSYGAKKSKRPGRNLATAYRVAELFPIIDINKSIMDVFGELKCGLEREGKTIDDMDLLIASTALSHNLILVTNDISHFSRIKDLRIENWKD